MANAFVTFGCPIIGGCLLIASWCADGKGGELCNLAALAFFVFSIAWYLSGKKRKGGDSE